MSKVVLVDRALTPFTILVASVSQSRNGRVIFLNKAGVYSAHQMGSCRLSTTPEGGPLRETGETWECDGLFVADASVFPTSLGINPMITVEAVAYMVAEQVCMYVVCMCYILYVCHIYVYVYARTIVEHWLISALSALRGYRTFLSLMYCMCVCICCVLLACCAGPVGWETPVFVGHVLVIRARACVRVLRVCSSQSASWSNRNRFHFVSSAFGPHVSRRRDWHINMYAVLF